MSTEIPSPADRLLLLDEVAERAQISMWSVRVEIKRGNLRATSITKKLLRVSEADYAAWVASRAETRTGDAS